MILHRLNRKTEVGKSFPAPSPLSNHLLNRSTNMDQLNCSTPEALRVGIDLGSTTTKIVALTPDSDTLFYSDYARHHAHLRNSIIHALSLLQERAGAAPLHVSLTGSGARPLAEELGLPLMQEVAADAAAVQVLCPEAQTVIELGGQDAKVIFFGKDSHSGVKEVADMRMNDTCAGGTGAFIDEMAKILHIPENEMNTAAENGKTVRDISGRCGVFARADVQPLLNQGISRETILKALRAEGIGCVPGYLPVYTFPCLQGDYIRKCIGSDINVNPDTPATERICYETGLWFLQNMMLSEPEAMEEIAAALRKISENLDELR